MGGVAGVMVKTQTLPPVAERFLLMAKSAPKRDWRVYAAITRKLEDMPLTASENGEARRKLAKILGV
jgi:hypothetical protein